MVDLDKDKLLVRWEALKQERASWIAHWREVSEVLLPRSGRFLVTDRNRGEKRHNNILDSTATRSLRILAAGLMSTMTSPARPWMRVTTSDPDLADYGSVKLWLSQVTDLLLRIYTKSNTYRALHSVYEELGAFGTGVSIMASNYDTVVHHHALTVGEYAVATDWQGKVCTLYREFEVTVGALVKEFGLDKVSAEVRNAYNSNQLEKWIPVLHVIEPRADREAGKRDSKNMPWRSIYLEVGGTTRDGILRESGFEIFPGLAPRWAVAGGDIYGTSPGMEVLGDLNQLMHQQLRKAEGIDVMTRPPLQLPTGLKGHDVDAMPGGLVYHDAMGAGSGIRPLFESRLDLNHLLVDIQDVRQRIREGFYADLFLMLTQQVEGRMTATEVAERHEEKLLMLGPVAERLHNELLDPMTEGTFLRALRAGILPPPPQELQGQDLNVEYVSTMAQAQRAVGTNSVDRFVMALGQVATIRPDVLDKLDADHWADEYSEMLGISPKLIVPSDKVAIIRAERAKVQQQQAQQAAAAQASQSLKNVSQADPAGLRDVMQMFSGYTTPGG